MSQEQADGELEALLDYIRRNRGFDFTGYKRPSLGRRIRKRMSEAGIDSFAEYRDLLEANSDEFVLLFNTILINVTSFFRDAPAWEYISAEVVPRILDAKHDLEPIRVWSSGCATGEEAFTIAMVIAEVAGEETVRERVKIYATDVDLDALQKGRHASYTEKQVAPVPPELREKYFEFQNGNYTFRSDLRRSVIFGRHDLIQDPPISRVDLLAARNTLMYLAPETQTKILAAFHFALNPGGFLFLGKSEVLLSRSNLFEPVDLRRRVFRPVRRSTLSDNLLRLVERDEDRDEARESTALVRAAALEGSPIPQLVIAEEGTLAGANLQARMLFDIGAHEVGKPLGDLRVSYRPLELRSQIERVYAEGGGVLVRNVEFRTPTGDHHVFDVQLTPVGPHHAAPVGVVVAFVDVTRAKLLQDSVEQSKRELETAYEELQSTTEELETTNEELQSTNEELETTNEELQSTNEELETMNEELQSTNEELEALNDELRTRTDDLNDVNAFLEAILGSLDTGIAVLDRDLRVTAWNGHATELWGITSDEVVSARFLDLDFGLPVGQLRDPIKATLDGGEHHSAVLEAVDRRGRPVTVRVSFSQLVHDSGSRGVIVLMEPNPDGSAPARGRRRS
jgi:two-component system, chemotaxis family, CheB/CheR fusion protein